MLSESEKDRVREEARGILDKFGKVLEKVDSGGEIIEKKLEEGKRVDGYREERGEGKEVKKRDNGFKKRLLANAPNADGDCIVAEKANW